MNVIRQLRDSLGLTQKQLSIEAGTSQPTIAAYENGKKSPTITTVARIADSLGLEITWQFQKSLKREELRSLAYHHAICDLLTTDEDRVRERAKKNLRRMKKEHPHAARLINLWNAWLDLPLETLKRLILERSELATDMRQVTPFSGLLSAEERREILGKFGSTDDYSTHP